MFIEKKDREAAAADPKQTTKLMDIMGAWCLCVYGLAKAVYIRQPPTICSVLREYTQNLVFERFGSDFTNKPLG